MPAFPTPITIFMTTNNIGNFEQSNRVLATGQHFRTPDENYCNVIKPFKIYSRQLMMILNISKY